MKAKKLRYDSINILYRIRKSTYISLTEFNFANLKDYNYNFLDDYGYSEIEKNNDEYDKLILCIATFPNPIYKPISFLLLAKIAGKKPDYWKRIINLAKRDEQALQLQALIAAAKIESISGRHSYIIVEKNEADNTYKCDFYRASYAKGRKSNPTSKLVYSMTGLKQSPYLI